MTREEMDALLDATFGTYLIIVLVLVIVFIIRW